MNIFKDINVDNLEFPRRNQKLNGNIIAFFKILSIFSNSCVYFYWNGTQY